MELKPCPFCGNRAQIVDASGGSYIRCVYCRAASNVEFDDVDRLYAAWNTRHKECKCHE